MNDRQRRYRDRQRLGIVVLHVPVDIVDHVETLIESELLKREQADDLKAVAAATAAALALMARPAANDNG